MAGVQLYDNPELLLFLLVFLSVALLVIGRRDKKNKGGRK